MKVSAVAFDEHGAIWMGKKEYDLIEVLLDDAEHSIKRWVEENWDMTTD